MIRRKAKGEEWQAIKWLPTRTPVMLEPEEKYEQAMGDSPK